MRAKNLEKFKIETLCVHGYGHYDPIDSAVAIPIYMTSTYSFKDADEGQRIITGEQKGHFYTRMSNPTTEQLEKQIAVLEGGDDAAAFGSGMAATTSIVLTLVKSGENFISSNSLYGGTHDMFINLLPNLNIEAREIDATHLENVEKNIDEKTKFIFIETPANPSMELVDIEGCAKIAKKHGIPLVVDNTFCTPCIQKPLALGADIIMHSGTKYIGGHGDSVSGLVIGNKEFMKLLKKGTLKRAGAIISPFNAWLLLRGLKTLSVRMERHSYNAMKIAEFLENHPKVEWIMYPGLKSHPQHELAKKQMKSFGGMISFELKGGYEAGVKLMNSVQLHTLAVSLGDCDSLIQHPASMTHRSYTDKQKKEAKLTDGLVRISVGIENVDDLIKDLEMSLMDV